MMTTFQTVSEALDAQRNALVNEYVSRAWRMWRSLTPADFWNDAVTQAFRLTSRNSRSRS